MAVSIHITNIWARTRVFGLYIVNTNWTSFVLQQRQNLKRRLRTSKMHLSCPVALAAVCSETVVMLLLIRCWLLLPLWNSVIALCFVVRNFMSILVLQSSWWGRESWLLYFVCFPGVSWLLCGSSSRWHGFVCSLWLWHFLIILTIFFYSIWSDEPAQSHQFSHSPGKEI